MYDQFWGTAAEFDAAMIRLRTRRVRQYWHSEVTAKLRDDQRQEVARCVRPLLKLVGSVQVAIGRYDPGKNELSLDVRDSAGKNGLITSTTPHKPYDEGRELTANYLGRSNWNADPYSNLDLFALHVYNTLVPSAQLEAVVAASLP